MLAVSADAWAMVDTSSTIRAIETSNSTRVKPAERVVVRVLTARPFSVGAPEIDLNDVVQQDGGSVVGGGGRPRRRIPLQVHRIGPRRRDADDAVEVGP